MIDRNAFASAAGLTADQSGPLLDEWEGRPDLTDLRWLAYILATVEYETGGAMTPLEEEGKGAGHSYGWFFTDSGDVIVEPATILDGDGEIVPNPIAGEPVKVLPEGVDGHQYYGRGYLPRHTFTRRAYQWASVGINLVHEPERLLDPAVAAKVAIDSMTAGLNGSTNLTLRQFFNDTREDWREARQIIGGDDEADEIADRGRALHRALIAAT